MSKRFGRNQRRRARERIADLERQAELLSADLGAALHRERQDGATYVQLTHWLEDLGIDAAPAFCSPLAIRMPAGMSPARSYRIPRGTRRREEIRAGEGLPTQPHGETLELFSVASEVRLDETRARDEVHMMLSFGEHERSAYYMSRESLRNGANIEELTRRVAAELVGRVVELALHQ